MKLKLPLFATLLTLLFPFLVLFLLVYFSLFSSSHLSSSPTTTSAKLSSQINLIKQTNHRTNFLILGIGGEGHQAPNLTDTIIFVSFNHLTQIANLISIPRDLWLPDIKAKVNTIYQSGLTTSSPLDYTQKQFSYLLDQPIHYIIVIDFHGFVQLIDLVGGLDINVERSFDDYRYPIPGQENAWPISKRYQHLHFDKGWQHMDGQTALKFARSRHAQGEEGTDFARSQRQQKIILAFIHKLFTFKTLSPLTLTPLIKTAQQTLITNIKPSEYLSFLQLFLSWKKAGAKTHSLNIDSLLYNPPISSLYAYQWILLPKDWHQLRQFIVTNLQ